MQNLTKAFTALDEMYFLKVFGERSRRDDKKYFVRAIITCEDD